MRCVLASLSSCLERYAFWSHQVQNAADRRFVYMTSLAIEELPVAIKEDVKEFLENHPGSPAARLRPRMGMVGELWLAFVGPKLQRGATGLGQTPRDALKDCVRWDCGRNSISTMASRSATRTSRSRCSKESRHPKRLITCHSICQIWRHCEKRSHI